MHSESYPVGLNGFRNEPNNRVADSSLSPGSSSMAMREAVNVIEEEELHGHSDAAEKAVPSLLALSSPFLSASSVVSQQHSVVYANETETFGVHEARKGNNDISLGGEAGLDYSTPASSGFSFHLGSPISSHRMEGGNEEEEQALEVTLLSTTHSTSHCLCQLLHCYTKHQQKKTDEELAIEEEEVRGESFLVTSLRMQERCVEDASTKVSGSSPDINPVGLSFSGVVLLGNKKEKDKTFVVEKDGVDCQEECMEEAVYSVSRERSREVSMPASQHISDELDLQNEEGKTLQTPTSAVPLLTVEVAKKEKEGTTTKALIDTIGRGTEIVASSPEDFLDFKGSALHDWQNYHPHIQAPDSCHDRAEEEVSHSLEGCGTNGFLGESWQGGASGSADYKESGNDVTTMTLQWTSFSAYPESFRSHIESKERPFSMVYEDCDRGVRSEEYGSSDEDECYGIHDAGESKKTRSWIERLSMHGNYRVHSPPPPSYPFLMDFSSSSRSQKKTKNTISHKGNKCSTFSDGIPSSSSSLTAITGESTTRRSRRTAVNRKAGSKHHHYHQQQQQGLYCRHSDPSSPSRGHGCSSKHDQNCPPPLFWPSGQGCCYTSNNSCTSSIHESEKCKSMHTPKKCSSTPQAPVSAESFSSPRRVYHQSHCDSHGYLCTAIPPGLSSGANFSSCTCGIPISPTSGRSTMTGTHVSLPVAFSSDDLQSQRGGDTSIQMNNLGPPCQPLSCSFRGHVSCDSSYYNISLHHPRDRSCGESFVSHPSVSQRALDPNEPPLDV